MIYDDTRSFHIVERDARYKKWKMAVERSLGWASVKMSDQMTGKSKSIGHLKPEITDIPLRKYVRLCICK